MKCIRTITTSRPELCAPVQNLLGEEVGKAKRDGLTSLAAVEVHHTSNHRLDQQESDDSITLLTSTLMAQRPMALTALRTKSTSTSVAYSFSSASTYDTRENMHVAQERRS